MEDSQSDLVKKTYLGCSVLSILSEAIPMNTVRMTKTGNKLKRIKQVFYFMHSYSNIPSKFGRHSPKNFRFIPLLKLSSNLMIRIRMNRFMVISLQKYTGELRPGKNQAGWANENGDRLPVGWFIQTIHTRRLEFQFRCAIDCLLPHSLISIHEVHD